MVVMDGRCGIAYNPLRYMGLTMSRGAVLLLAGALAGCALFSSSGRIIHQQGRTTVQLEKDPSAGGTFISTGNSHPASIKAAQVATILRGIQIRSEQGVVGTLLSLAAPADTVFTEEEVTQLAPLLADGLAQAAQSERVGFTHWSSQPGRRNGPLLGHIAVRESYLRFGLNDHPTVGWQDPEDPSSPKLFTLEFQRESFVRPVSDEEQKSARKARPIIQIDYRRYLAAPQDHGAAVQAQDQPAAAPVPAPSTSRPVPPPATAPMRDAAVSESSGLKDLQRQVKELTDSNQELRAKLREMRDRQDQSQAMSEELARLRQELAETKQLLADKVLELNRPKGKSGGSKGKALPPPSR
jgi:hypothetical protein